MSYIRIDLTGYAREPGFSHYEIWRHTADIPSPNSPPERVTRSATRVGEHVANERWEDTSAVGGRTYWYWARALDRYANPSPFFAVGTIIAPMANITMNSDRLLGRDTPGAGDVEEIEATAPLEFDGAGSIRIAAQGVTFADHIQHIATARILGRLTAATGAIEGLTATDARDVLGLSTTSTVQFGQIGIGSGTLTGSIHVRMNTITDPPSFSVVASGLIVSRATGSGITLHTTDTGTNYIAFADTTLGANHWLAYRHADDALDVRTGNALRLTVSSAGVVSTVGVTAPTYTVASSQVVGARITGWDAATGTATRTAFDTSTVTLPELAERLKALIDDLRTHGLIGT
jgi:hypothetical protein